jgi:hypothetical protein
MPEKLNFIFLIIYYSFIHICPAPLPDLLPFPPIPLSLSGRTCSALISNFVEEKT